MTGAPVTGIIGPGRFGRSLARGLTEIGIHVHVLGRSPAAEYAAMAGACEVICLTVKDHQIAGLAQELAINDLTGKTVLMHSGTVPLDVLEPLSAKGARVGKFHPLQTFTGGVGSIPAGTPFAFEGPIRDLVAPWTRAWSASLHQLEGSQWLVYHIAAVTAANFLPLLIRAGADLLEPMTRDQTNALNWLAPLVRQTVEAALDGTNKQPYSGPAIRDDTETIARHAKWLSDNQPDLLPLYRMATEHIRQIPGQKPKK